MDREKLMNALRKADAAGDEAAARAIARRLSSMDQGSDSPVTPEAPAQAVPDEESVGWLQSLFGGGGDDPRYPSMNNGSIEEAVAEGDRGDGRAAAGLQSFLDNVTLGAGPLAERHGGALGSSLRNAISGAEPDATYSDFVRRIEEDRAATTALSPGFSVAGGLAGSLVGPGAVASKATQAFPKLATSVGARLGFGGLLGAGEAVGTEAGKGNIEGGGDLAQMAALGAGLGVAGQGVAEVAGPLLRFAKSRATQSGAEEAAKRHIGKSLSTDARGRGSLAADLNRGVGLTDDQQRAMAASAGNGRMVGEYNNSTLALTERLVASPDATGMTGPAVDTAKARLRGMNDQGADILEDALTDPTRTMTAAQAKAKRAYLRGEAAEVFQDIFDTPEGRNRAVAPRESLSEQARLLPDDRGGLVFEPQNMAPSTRNALERFDTLVNQMGTDEGLTLKGLQNLKFDLDKQASAAWQSADSAADGVDARALTSLKGMVNRAIGDIDVRYKEYSPNFADDESAKTAAQEGIRLISGTNRTAPLDTIDMSLKAMTGGERQAAQDAALGWIKGEMGRTDATLKKIATDNPDMMGRLRMIFGQDVNLDELSDAMETVAVQKRSYAQIAGAERAAIGNSSPTGSEDEAGGIFDKVITAFGLGRGSMPFSAARRTVSRALRGDPAAYTRNLLDLMQSSDPKEAMDLMEEIIRLKNAPNASMKGSVAGSAAAPSIMSGE